VRDPEATVTRQRKPAERGQQPWRFFQDADARWRWKYMMNGKAVAQAYEGFAEYADCVADAQARGYRAASAK
jgi:hypothetical protein